jgi:hypothetical protein
MDHRRIPKEYTSTLEVQGLPISSSANRKEALGR